MQPAPTPAVFALYRNVPNPFNPTTRIEYELPRPGVVTLHIYDATGRLVRVLVDGVHQQAGGHSVGFDGRSDSGRRLASGVYFYHIQAGGISQVRRMVLLK